MLLLFEARATQRRLASEIDAKFRTFYPLYKCFSFTSDSGVTRGAGAVGREGEEGPFPYTAGGEASDPGYTIHGGDTLMKVYFCG